MGFKQAIGVCLRSKYATFSGRASLAEFWWFVLFYFMVSLVLSVTFLVALFAPAKDNFLNDLWVPIALVSIVFSLGMFIPMLAVAVRRLHDTGRSGLTLLHLLLTVVGVLAAFFLCMLPSDPKSNAYGKSPAAPPPPPKADTNTLWNGLPTTQEPPRHVDARLFPTSAASPGKRQ